MIDFFNIDYLKTGNARQKSAFQLLESKKIISQLAAFDPVLVGTIPINIDIENSDVDIICYWESKLHFADQVKQVFGDEAEFTIRQTFIHGKEAVVANFNAESFEIEIFGQNIPVREQFGYRHMLIEHQVLEAKGEAFRQEIIVLKRKGYKTEPAFALLLGLKGDPYFALLEYNV